jgi:4'-phosphopantetheinyl transferase
MPLEKIDICSDRAWALWKVEEDEETLIHKLVPHDKIPDGISNSKKRLEWYVGRTLVKTLLQHWNINYQGITKDGFGKPFLIGYNFHLSLSHSYPYVAAVIDKHKQVGIDLEQPKEKLLKIAPRILENSELLDAGRNLTKHCIYWCSKETLIKVYGKKDLIFAENLKICPFSLEKEGNITGQIIVNRMIRNIALHYQVMENFVLVMSI